MRPSAHSSRPIRLKRAPLRIPKSLGFLNRDSARSIKFAGVEAPPDFFNGIRHERTSPLVRKADVFAYPGHAWHPPPANHELDDDIAEIQLRPRRVPQPLQPGPQPHQPRRFQCPKIGCLCRVEDASRLTRSPPPKSRLVETSWRWTDSTIQGLHPSWIHNI